MIPILDIETAPDPDVLPLLAEALAEIHAPATYKDPEKIAAYVAEKRAERIAKCAVDIDELRIVALGLLDGDGTHIRLCRDESEERLALQNWWARAKAYRSLMQSSGSPSLVAGFCCLRFDVPALMRRSQILRVPIPTGLIRLDRYRGNVLDLANVLTDNGASSQFPKKLEFYARRFGLVAADAPYSHGSDVPQWVEAGDWASIESHLRQDLDITQQLGARLGAWE